jgi:hypothetical protein
MKKKLLILLITLASTMMPNLVSAIAIPVGEGDDHETTCMPVCLYRA